MINTIIFDLDGTLVDCKELHQMGFRYAMQKMVPHCVYSDEEVEGMSTTQKIQYFNDKGLNIPYEVDLLKKQFTRDHLEDYVKYNDSLAGEIDRLDKSYNLCLVSNARSEFVLRVLNILKIWQLRVVYCREHGPSKPDPTMYWWAMSACGSNSQSTVIFEDSPVGIMGATLSGARVVPITDSTHLIETLKNEF